MISQQSKLAEKLKNIVVANQYASVSFSLATPCFLNRWLVSSAVCKRNDDLTADVRCDLESKVVVGSEVESLQDNELESSWRYYISDDTTSFYKRNSPEKIFPLPISKSDEKYIYALSSVITEKEGIYLVHISTMMPMPIRIWINGELLFADTIAYIQKNHIFSYCFKKGINTILIEKPLCAWNRRLHMTPKFFSVSIRQLETVINNQFAYEINEASLLKDYLNQYTIIPNKLFYESNEPIQLIIFSNKSENTNIRLSVSTSMKESKLELSCICGNETTIQTNSGLSGLVKISIGQQSTYLFIGKYSEYITYIKEQIELVDDKDIDTYSMSFNIDILDAERGLVKNSIEPIHSYYSQDVFRKLFAFEKYLLSNQINNELTNGFVALESPVDKTRFACYLELPKRYKCGTNYPLVVYLNFDDSLTRIPTNPHRILKDNDIDAISLTLCGRGNFINDYINSYEIICSIKEISKRYSVDTLKISVFGICTGGRRGFELVNKYRGIFSSMLSFASTSINAGQAAGNIPLIQLCNIDDMFYNGATVLSRLEKDGEKLFIMNSFEHEELIDYYSHSNTARLLIPYQNTVEIETNISYGIKGIYLEPCCIVKPSLANKEIENKLLLLLTKPVVSRARNYNVPVIDIHDECEIRKSNIVFIIDNNAIDNYPSALATASKNISSKLTSSHESYIIITNNPYNFNKKAVFITYSDVDALNKIMSLLGSFESNPLFDEDVIILNEKVGM